MSISAAAAAGHFVLYFKSASFCRLLFSSRWWWREFRDELPHTAFTNTNSICRCRFTNTTHTFTSDPSTLSLFRKEQNNQTNSKLLLTAVYGSTAFKSKQTNKQNWNLLNHSSKNGNQLSVQGTKQRVSQSMKAKRKITLDTKSMTASAAAAAKRFFCWNQSFGAIVTGDYTQLQSVQRRRKEGKTLMPAASMIETSTSLKDWRRGQLMIMAGRLMMKSFEWPMRSESETEMKRKSFRPLFL